MQNVILDVATLDTTPNAAIVCISMLVVPAKGKPTIYTYRIDRDSIPKSLDKSVECENWWIRQPDEKRKELKGMFAHNKVMKKIYKILLQDNTTLWSDNIIFDYLTLSNNLDCYDVPNPVTVDFTRCLRTLKHLYPLNLELKSNTTKDIVTFYYKHMVNLSKKNIYLF